MTEETAPSECYLPDCPASPRWGVTDLDGAGRLAVCTPHLPRLVHRKMKRTDARVIVSPLFEVGDVAELAPLVAVGCEVYGLCADLEIPRRVDSLPDADYAALVRSYGGVDLT